MASRLYLVQLHLRRAVRHLGYALHAAVTKPTPPTPPPELTGATHPSLLCRCEAGPGAPVADHLPACAWAAVMCSTCAGDGLCPCCKGDGVDPKKELVHGR